MKQAMDYIAARDLLLELVTPVGTKPLPLEDCFGRVLAADLIAGENVPAFDRSPYDGYALRASDTQTASRETPVTLTVTQELPAGAVPSCDVTPGTAAKILTGAPIPSGADAVVMFEKTQFTDRTVTVFAPVSSGSNIIRAGEDVQAGTVLAAAGTVIDPGLLGTLAAQGVDRPEVYQTPRIGLISTGSEVRDFGQDLEPGTIRNTNRYTIASALAQTGCDPVYLSRAGDDASAIAGLIRRGLEACDGVLLTGGVSVGDYDLTPAAMEQAGAEIFIRGLGLKPGMACAMGTCAGKLVCGLSGNPASAMTAYYAVVLPALRKLAGRHTPVPPEVTLTLAQSFPKSSRSVRMLRGRLDLSTGRALLHLPPGQGNVVISSMIGCDAMAIVPAGSGPLEAGTELKGFLL